MLVCWPIIVVVKVGSELMMSPFKLQVIDKGLSPVSTAHISCAVLPWLIDLSPKEKGTICGGSVNIIFSVHFCWITIDFKFCRIGCHSCRIFSSAGIHSNMCVIHWGYDKHTGLCPQHGGGHWIIRGCYVPLETPCNGKRSVTATDNTSQLCKFSLVYSVKSKGERNNLRFLCK